MIGANDTSIVEQLWPIGAAGVFALVGAWLGKSWEARTGHDAWLRDKRLGVFVRFNEACHEAWLQSDLIFRVDKAERLAQYRKIAEASRTLYQLTGEIRILCPAELHERSIAVRKAFDTIRDAVRVGDDLDGLTEEYGRLGETPIGRAADARTKEFVSAAQRSIGATKS